MITFISNWILPKESKRNTGSLPGKKVELGTLQSVTRTASQRVDTTKWMAPALTPKTFYTTTFNRPVVPHTKSSILEVVHFDLQ